MKKILMMLLVIALAGCASHNEDGVDEHKNTKSGAALGGFVGAVAGGLLSKGDKKAAAAGAAVGAVAGGLYGKKLDKQAEELREVAETRRTDQGIVTKLKGDITFETGKAQVTSEAQKRLRKMADILKKYPENNITVLGHTDSTGTTRINEKLSERRAESVKSILVNNGVNAKNIKTMGLAAKDPIADNSTASGRAENRRVEMAITMGEDSERMSE
ncbi:MAG: hypothetical protein CME62_09335 [Halobacteriovoraceae bacterium]|nr:hypothetical protein [Halobacteriovoraceae bacterium]|tara:strand:- start:2140 stop:2787 length:648 start_codon:yes stop_codon:yes gene_type:complete